MFGEKENIMEYHIKNENGDIIASFICTYDRDMCLDLYEETFPDCKFFKVGFEE